MSQNAEDSDEQDDDINIDNQSSKDVIIQSKSIFTTTHDKLSIIDQIETINDDSSDSNADSHIFRHFSPEPETSEDTHAEKTPAEDPQNGTTSSEISLGSAGIDSEGNSEGKGQESAVQDGVTHVERGDICDKVSFTQSEERKEIIIGGDSSGHTGAAGDHNANNEGDNTSNHDQNVGEWLRLFTTIGRIMEKRV